MRADCIGERFGRLVVAEYKGSNGKRSLWRCVCDCGGEATRSTDALRRAAQKGSATSCGCLAIERITNLRKTHGATSGRSVTPEFQAWAGMKGRCSNPNDAKYHRYGGRGIYVCERWANSFDTFFADMGPRPSPRHSVDRIDLDGPYSPGNCQWAEPKVQSRNTSRNIFVEVGGARMCATDAALQFGIPISAFLRRLHRGWTAAEALSTPLRQNNPNYRLHHHRFQKKARAT